MTGADKPRCTGTNNQGEPCGRPPQPGTDRCISHGDSERRCQVRSKTHIKAGADDPRCGRPASPGQTVCRFHGGAAKHATKAGQRRLAEQEVARLVETYGLPVEISPQDAILAEVHRTAGHVAWLEQQVHALTEGELVWGITKVKQGGDDYGTTEEAVPHAMLRLYNEERDRLVRVCAAALRAGVEERRVKLAEQQGALVAGVIRSILADLKLSPAQSALVSEVVPRHLRELAASTAATN
jgi:hypothetical protein